MSLVTLHRAHLGASHDRRQVVVSAEGRFVGFANNSKWGVETSEPSNGQFGRSRYAVVSHELARRQNLLTTGGTAGVHLCCNST